MARGRRQRASALLALGVAALLAYAVLGAQRARAADPQPYRIDWVSSGNSAVDSAMRLTSQLEALRQSAPVGPYGLIARARGDLPRLRTVLHSYGYYEGSVAITIDRMPLDRVGLGNALAALAKGTDAQVTITPRLGPLFHLGRIDIEGELPAGMRSHLHLAPGAPAVAEKVLAAGARLQAALQDAGFAFAKVAKPLAYELPAQRVLNLSFRVRTGPRLEIGTIRIEGLRHVHEAFVRRTLSVHTGERYDAAEVRQARGGLLSLGLFSSVSTHLGAPAQGRVPVTFAVEEAKRFTAGVTAAYSSDLGGSAGFDWSDRNVFGNGEELSLSTRAIDLGGTASTGLGYDGTAAFTLPEFRRPDQTLAFTVTALRQTLIAYTQNGELAGTSLTRRFSPRWTVIGGVSFEHENIEQEGVGYRYELLSVPLDALYNSTDLSSPLLSPTHGVNISLHVAPTFSYGGSGKTYIVLQSSIASYFDLHKLLAGDPAGRTVIAARAIGGVALGASQFSLPPDQRFYAGGAGTVRGYRYQSVGPQFANGVPMGGTNMQAVNLELRQRVGRNFGFVVFADAGGVSSPYGSVYRVGVGTGVLYFTSIGPIRFDVGLPTRPLRYSDPFEIYIGLGQAF